MDTLPIISEPSPKAPLRVQYNEQLSQLNMMGAHIEHAIDLAIHALVNHDASLAHEAIELDQGIDNQERGIERICMSLFLHQQPIARDLRMVSTALKMVTDMERIGDYAVDIAEISLTLEGMMFALQLERIPAMAEAASKMVTDSINAYVHRDQDLAQAAIDEDDIVDNLLREVKTDLVELIRDDKERAGQALDLLMIAKYFEKIGDHAVNIGDWVIFSLTGEHKHEKII